MTITIKINTDNAAFEGDRYSEVVRIIRDDVLPALELGGSIRLLLLRDSNGNGVGSVKVSGR